MLASLAFAVSAAVCVSATLSNLTVTDQSPTIEYFPSRWGNSAETWNVTYTGNDWSTFSPGNLSQGTSYHYTTYIGATATFGFRGPAVYVMGEGSASDFTVTVGGEEISDAPWVAGMLAHKSGMKDQWWDVVVKVTGSGGVSLTGITFTLNIGNDGATLSSRAIPALDAQHGPNPDLSFSGQWGARTTDGRLTYDRVDTSAGNARVVLPAITGETLIVGYGSINYDHGRFTIDSSGPVAGWPSTDTFNGSSPFWSIDQILFFGMADWGVMSVTNMDGGSWIDIHEIRYVAASGGTNRTDSSPDPSDTSPDPSGSSRNPTDTSSGGLPIGVIVGAVVGGAVVLAIAGVLIWLCLKRRKKLSADYYSPNQVDDTRYDIDPYTETTVGSPRQDRYFDSPEMAYANAAGLSPISPYGSKSPTSRNSFASTPGYIPGHTPSQPHSPGMSEGSSSHQPNSPNDQSSSQSNRNRHSKSPRQLPVPGNQVRQEMDAGRVALVPPSYDPTWAQDNAVTDVNVDREDVRPVSSVPVHSEAGNMK